MKVWSCKIIIEDGELPPGFDSPPRMAAQEAIEAAGFKVLSNSSGWGGSERSKIQELEDSIRWFVATHESRHGNRDLMKGWPGYSDHSAVLGDLID